MYVDDARDILTGQVKTLWDANWSEYDLFFENKDVGPNFAKAKEIFAEFRTLVDFTRQVTIGDSPVISYNCALFIDVYLPKGAGTKIANDIHKDLIDLLNCKNFSGVVTHAPAPMKPVPTKGWYVMPLHIPYHFSSLS